MKCTNFSQKACLMSTIKLSFPSNSSDKEPYQLDDTTVYATHQVVDSKTHLRQFFFLCCYDLMSLYLQMSGNISLL